MSDREMRALLHQVMTDIEEGRIAPKPLPFRRLGRFLAPPLLAASLGLAGCTDNNVGYYGDAAYMAPDVAVQDASVDAGPVVDAAYMAPFDAAVDSGPEPPYMGPPFDAGVDSGPEPPYMAPPFDAGPQPDYMSPFDGGVVAEDGGSVPAYMGPPPLPEDDGDSEEDSE